MINDFSVFFVLSLTYSFFMVCCVSHLHSILIRFCVGKKTSEGGTLNFYYHPWHKRKGFAIHHLMPSNSTIKPLGTHCMSLWNWFKISLNEAEIFIQTPQSSLFSFANLTYPVTGLRFNQILSHQIFYAFMMRAIQKDVFMLYHYIFYSDEKWELSSHFFCSNFNQI